MANCVLDSSRRTSEDSFRKGCTPQNRFYKMKIPRGNNKYFFIRSCLKANTFTLFESKTLKAKKKSLYLEKKYVLLYI